MKATENKITTYAFIKGVCLASASTTISNIYFSTVMLVIHQINI
jgi:hypothetical protein